MKYATRKPRSSKLTGAELYYLTGDAGGQHVNKFELIGLEMPTKPRDFDRIEALIDKATGIVPADRLEQLRAELAGLRARYRERYPDAA